MAKLIKQPPADPEALKAKEVRTLKKRLRQARELRQRKENGDNLLPEQIGKVFKISELVRQPEGLGVGEGGLDLDQAEPSMKP